MTARNSRFFVSIFLVVVLMTFLCIARFGCRSTKERSRPESRTLGGWSDDTFHAALCLDALVLLRGGNESNAIGKLEFALDLHIFDLWHARKSAEGNRRLVIDDLLLAAFNYRRDRQPQYSGLQLIDEQSPSVAEELRQELSAFNRAYKELQLAVSEAREWAMTRMPDGDAR